MTVDEAREHFAFDDWANARYVAVLAELSPAALTAPVTSSFPSILETFAHLVGAEWVWLRRWLGESPRAQPEWLNGASLESLRARLAAVQEERGAFLAGLTGEDSPRVVTYRLMNGTERSDPLGALFLHAVNHSTFHRGQLATLLRQAGAVPPSSDLVAYRWERTTA